MNTGRIKTYAPKARRDFIAAATCCDDTPVEIRQRRNTLST